MSFLSKLPFGGKDKTIPLVVLSGVISSEGRFSKGLSLRQIDKTLEKAFSQKSAPAVALIINSPGGSPVQSSLIGQRIRSLAEKNNKKVYAFVEDVAASGGYWLAAAADEIYLDPSSIVGSIGVISAGFGYTKFLSKHGIERRVYTAGDNKMRLDSFQPEKKEDVEWVLGLQKEIHAQFKEWILERRGAALTKPANELMNGDVWLGERAVELGLADGLGTYDQVLKNAYGEKTKMVFVEGRKKGIRSRLGLLSSLGTLEASGTGITQLPEALLSEVERRDLWGRFGL